MGLNIILIGEAPGKSGAPGEPALMGRIGARLTRLMGITPTQYAYGFKRVNLLPRWPGKAPGNGSAWPAKRARLSARRMENEGLFRKADNFVILLGRRVAGVFGFGEAEWFTTFVIDHATVVVVPHPSGASRWWNEPRNARRAERFWSGVVVRVGALRLSA